MATEFVTSYKIIVDNIWVGTVPSTSTVISTLLYDAPDDATIIIIKTKTKVDCNGS